MRRLLTSQKRITKRYSSSPGAGPFVPVRAAAGAWPTAAPALAGSYGVPTVVATEMLPWRFNFDQSPKMGMAWGLHQPRYLQLTNGDKWVVGVLTKTFHGTDSNLDVCEVVVGRKPYGGSWTEMARVEVLDDFMLVGHAATSGAILLYVTGTVGTNQANTQSTAVLRARHMPSGVDVAVPGTWPLLARPWGSRYWTAGIGPDGMFGLRISEDAGTMDTYAPTNDAWHHISVGKFDGANFSFATQYSVQGGLRTAYGALGVGMAWTDDLVHVGAVNVYNKRSEFRPWDWQTNPNRIDDDAQPFIGIQQRTFSLAARTMGAMFKPLPANSYSDRSPFVWNNRNGNAWMRHKWSDWNPVTQRWLHLYDSQGVYNIANTADHPNGLYLISTAIDGSDPVQTYLSSAVPTNTGSPSQVYADPAGNVWVYGSWDTDASGERFYIVKLPPAGGNAFTVPAIGSWTRISAPFSPYIFQASWAPMRIGGGVNPSNGITLAFLVAENQGGYPESGNLFPSDHPYGRGNVAATQGARLLTADIFLP